MILDKLSAEERKSALNNLLKDQNNDLSKKYLLFKFAAHYSFKESDFEKEVEILKVCESILEKVPLKMQIQEKLAYANFYSRKNNEIELIKYIKEGVKLLREIPPNFIIKKQIHFKL